MNFENKEGRQDYLNKKLDDLVEGINNSYGQSLLNELVKRLHRTIEDFNEENLTHIWDVTTAHDTTIIENNQNGLLSHSFSPGVLSQNESAVTYFYDWYFTNMRLP